MLGYADQHYARSLAPELRVRELVGMQLGLRGAAPAERRRRADELLERVGLDGFGDRRPTELSGGEQQRVALCAALAHRPRVLLADEPTGELDAATAVEVYELLAGLVREHGCTTVLVSHDPSSTRIADRIVRIRDGRVSEEWTRAGGDGESIVVGRGGWLRLPEELLLRTGIGARATARLEGGAIIVEPSGERVDGAPEARARPEAAPVSAVVASARGVTRRFGAAAPVFEAVDVDLRGGRLYALTGPSGSGKTTLLHLLAGLELPDEGDVTVAGSTMSALDRGARAELRRRSIAYVGQQAGLVRISRRSRTSSSRCRCAVARARSGGRSRHSTPWGSASARPSTSRVCRRASVPGSPWRARSPPSRSCSWPTSRPRDSTARTRSRSRCSSPVSRARRAPPSSAQRTTRS